MSHTSRIQPHCAQTNPVHGRVVWAPVKSMWFVSILTVAIFAGPATFSWSALTVCGLLTTFTLCFGHSVGLHRLLIHRSFQCPRWLEYCMVFAGVLVEMGGPKKMLYMHDIRDWSQRQTHCHDFYIHRSSIGKDWFWNLHCELQLDHPPDFQPEVRVRESRFYQWLDRGWMLAQIPLALLLFALGGFPWVVWGICMRISLSLTGHWIVGYLAHNTGPQTWLVDGAAVQGHNLPGLGLITMGEAWHNNHHAFPESARLGISKGQNDPGWWLLALLSAIKLVWNVQQPGDLPVREELQRVAQHLHPATLQPIPKLATNGVAGLRP
jgi:fatty-acid desaturase